MFDSSLPLDSARFSTRSYFRLASAGILQNLLKLKEKEYPLVGKNARVGKGGVPWHVIQKHHPKRVRVACGAIDVITSKAFDSITYDHTAFTRVRDSLPQGTLPVFVPMHRSFIDPLLWSYLFYAHPELGFEIPSFAATSDFAKVAVIGQAMTWFNVFFIERNQGKEDHKLNERLHDLYNQGRSLMFFIEGARSRSGRFLQPKRGILRGLQKTGRTYAIIPLVMNYDRLPEEGSLGREARTGARIKMALRPALNWVAQSMKGEIDLGRVHMSCGIPQILSPQTDVREFGEQVLGEFQRSAIVSEFHLRSFCAWKQVKTFDWKWLKAALEERGATVIGSPIGDSGLKDSRETQLWRSHQWCHFFYKDALKTLASNPVLSNHLRKHDFMNELVEVGELNDVRLEELLAHLFEPIVAENAEVEQVLLNAKQTGQKRPPSPFEVVRLTPEAYYPNVLGVYQRWVEMGFLREDSRGQYVWGPKSELSENYTSRVENRDQGVSRLFH